MKLPVAGGYASTAGGFASSGPGGGAFDQAVISLAWVYIYIYRFESQFAAHAPRCCRTALGLLVPALWFLLMSCLPEFLIACA